MNERGDFVRTFGGRKREGIYSPITQNQRHINLIHAMRRTSRSVVENIMWDRDFDDVYRSLVVLANPKTILDDSRAPEEVRREIIRADQLISTIASINAEKGPGRDKCIASAARKSAEWFLSQCKDSPSVDYAAKYKKNVIEHASEMEDASNVVQARRGATSESEFAASSSDTIGNKVFCPKCGAPMVLRTAKRGAHAGTQFYGCSAFPKCRGIINLDEMQ